MRGVAGGLGYLALVYCVIAFLSFDGLVHPHPQHQCLVTGHIFSLTLLSLVDLLRRELRKLHSAKKN